MDIYVSKDGAYPPVLHSGHELFVLVGEHSAFVRAYLHELRARAPRVVMVTLVVAPDTVGAPRVAASTGLARSAIAVPSALGVADADPGTLTVHALYAPTRPGLPGASVVFVFCAPLAPLPPGLTLDGVPVTDASFLYTTPALAQKLHGCDNATRQAVFGNVAMRAAVSELIRDPRGAPLATLLACAVPQGAGAQTAVLPFGDADATRLARFSYDRERFRAFVVAWYKGQLSAMPSENEKIMCACDRVLRLL